MAENNFRVAVEVKNGKVGGPPWVTAQGVTDPLDATVYECMCVTVCVCVRCQIQTLHLQIPVNECYNEILVLFFCFLIFSVTRFNRLWAQLYWGSCHKHQFDTATKATMELNWRNRAVQTKGMFFFYPNRFRAGTSCPGFSLDFCVWWGSFLTGINVIHLRARADNFEAPRRRRIGTESAIALWLVCGLKFTSINACEMRKTKIRLFIYGGT